MNHESLWKKLILALLRITVVYSIVSVAVIAIAFRFLVPFFKESLPGVWGPLLSALVIILFIAPFLRAIMIKKNHSVEFVTLWRDSRGNRAPLVATIVLRILLAVSFGRPCFWRCGAAGYSDDTFPAVEAAVYHD